MLVTRKTTKEDELRFQVVSIVDGSRVNLDGLAETIRAARMRVLAGESPPQIAEIEGGMESNRGRGADCLSERMRRAKERVRRAQGLETMP